MNLGFCYTSFFLLLCLISEKKCLKIHEISVYSILDMFHYPSNPKKKKTHSSLIEQSLFAELFFFASINLVVLSCYLRSTLSCFTWIFSSGNLLRPYSAIVEEYIQKDQQIGGRIVVA